MAEDFQMVGSVGSLIGAAMETAGHYTQQAMLQVLDSGLASDTGALLFTIAAISGLFIFAIGGNYKFGLWFFLGPALFWWTINDRVLSDGANWKFGERPYSQQEVYKVTEGVVSQEGAVVGEHTRKPAEVARLFQIWNDLTSRIVQGFVDVIGVVKSNSDLTFINHTQRLYQILTAGINDPNLQGMIHVLLNNECTDYYVKLTETYGGPRGEALFEDQKQLKARGEKTVVNLRDHQEITGWISATKLDEDIKREFPGLYKGGTLSEVNCEQLWGIAVLALRKNANATIRLVASTNKPEGMSVDQVVDSIVKKLGYTTDPENATIKRIKVDSQEPLLILMNELAVRQLLSAIGSREDALAMLGKQKGVALQPIDSELRHIANSAEESSKAIRNLLKKEEWHWKGDFLTATLAMPYVQGLALYFLSLSFPFFAMALIVPGRHLTFLLWFGLWFWVKSWDIGFAIVMLIDEMLYALLPHSSNIPVDSEHNAAKAIKAVLEVDPTYSVATYYNLIGTCLASVPILTGALVKKGGDEILSAVNQGFQGFAGKIGGAMAAKAGSEISQMKGRNAAEMIFRESSKAQMEEFTKPNVLPRLLEKAGITLGKEMADKLKTGKLGDSSKASDVLASLTDTEKERVGRIMSAEFKKNINERLWNYSYSPEIVQLSAEGIQLAYYSHAFSQREYPIDALVGTYKAQHWFPMGGTTNKAFTSIGKDLIKRSAKSAANP